MPKLVCCKCEIELKIDKSGVAVIETFNSPAKPYKIWNADRWVCPECGAKIVAGFSANPIAEHYHDDFPDVLQRVLATETVVYDFESADRKTTHA